MNKSSDNGCCSSGIHKIRYHPVDESRFIDIRRFRQKWSEVQIRYSLLTHKLATFFSQKIQWKRMAVPKCKILFGLVSYFHISYLSQFSFWQW